MAVQENGRTESDLGTIVERETTSQKSDWKQWIPLYGFGKAFDALAEDKPSMLRKKDGDVSNVGVIYQGLTSGGVFWGGVAGVYYAVSLLFS